MTKTKKTVNKLVGAVSNAGTLKVLAPREYKQGKKTVKRKKPPHPPKHIIQYCYCKKCEEFYKS